MKSAAPSTVQTNLRTIAELDRTSEARRGFVDRIADLIANFSGTMLFVGIHVLWFTLWLLINTGVLPIAPKFDPYPFILLAMIVSVEGVLLSTFVLMKQNRMQHKSDARDHLNLQIDLLAEKEITKTLQLLRAICRRLDISEAEFGPELDEMTGTTSVDLVATEIRQTLPEE